MKITREVAKELLPFVKALAEGKMIQDKIEGLTGWVDTDEINLEFEGKKILHRIKPEPKCRPFKNREECWEEMFKWILILFFLMQRYEENMIYANFSSIIFQK